MWLSLFIKFKEKWYRHWLSDQPLSDESLLRMYREKGDVDLIGLLFERYTHLVFGVCMKYLKDEEAARDAVMEIFEKLMDELAVREITFFKTWLYSVSRNHCLIKIRRQTGENDMRDHYSKINNAGIMEIAGEMHLNVVDNAMENILDKLQRALLRLNEAQQVCIRLMYLEKKSYREIAGITGFSLNQVKSHIQNGKRNLKNLIEEDE